MCDGGGEGRVPPPLCDSGESAELKLKAAFARGISMCGGWGGGCYESAVAKIGS